MNGVRPLVLVTLDGWGLRAEREANAIALARTPIFDRLAGKGLETSLVASGEAVGLAPGQPGNAQAAYQTLGAGAPVEHPLLKVNRALEASGDDAITNHPVIRELIARARPLGGAVHLIGMASPAGIAGHQNHLAVLAALLSHEGMQVWVHAVMDGQDTPPQEGIAHLAELTEDIAGAENAELGSVMGRRYGFDARCDPARVEAALKALVETDAPRAEYLSVHLDNAYNKNLADDDIPPAISQNYRGIRADDAVLLVNLRPDHAHSLISALTGPDARPHGPVLSGVYSLLRLSGPLDAEVEWMYEPARASTTLAETLSGAGLSQLALCETAAETNLWTFARAGRDTLLFGETVLVADTPPPAKLLRRGELAAAEITNETVNAIKKASHDLIVANYPNAALLGRTGNLKATVAAVEAVDKQLGKIAAQIEKRGGTLLICGTYGKAERMTDPGSGEQSRVTTEARVPFVLASPANGLVLRPGTLADVAPTLLSLLDVDIPASMRGRPLIVPENEEADDPASAAGRIGV